MKGSRVQNVVQELKGEKIDIIPYSTGTERFIAASLSPAMVTEVVLDDENKRATVSVPEDQQSLAIGKEGQNARLANKLTKWKIDIKGTVGLFGSTEDGDEAGGGDKKVKGVWDEAIKEKKDAEPEEVPESTEEPSAEEEKNEETPEEVPAEEEAKKEEGEEKVEEKVEESEVKEEIVEEKEESAEEVKDPVEDKPEK